MSALVAINAANIACEYNLLQRRAALREPGPSEDGKHFQIRLHSTEEAN